MPSAYISNGHPITLGGGNDVCLEEGRINSFDNNWPHDNNSLCSKERMAKAGFYYYGHPDQVKCFVCLIKLGNWDPEHDDPWQKHRELSKDCQFAKLGKEDESLTMEQWVEIIRERTINILDAKLIAVQEALQS